MEQTAVKQLGNSFRQWQKEWDNYDGKKTPKPISYNEFMEPFLELEKQQQGYSNEEVLKFLINCHTNTEKETIEWFNKFKKK